VPLVFNDMSGHGGQFGDLTPSRFGIVGSSLSRQRRLAMAADRGNDGDNLGQALGRQAAPQQGRMAGLAAAFFAGGRFDDGRRRLRRVGRRRQRRVGGVLAESRFELAHANLQRGQTLVAFSTSRTTRYAHTEIL
jgi:hypothetical protein